MTEPKHLTTDELEAGLEVIRASPKQAGELKMIVRRPIKEAREALEEGVLDTVEGLVGDNWKTRGNAKTPDGSPNPDAQITVMNARAVALLAVEKDRWSLAGDQLYVDFDLSAENLPPGTRLAVGAAILEVSSHPHTGCVKFNARFGPAALKFVNSPTGKQLKLRGINTRVVQNGVIRVGDEVRKV